MIVYHGRSREQDRDSLFETWDEKESSCSRSSTLIDAHCVCLLHYAMWLLSSCCSSWLHRPVSRGHTARHSRTQGYLMDGKKHVCFLSSSTTNWNITIHCVLTNSESAGAMLTT